MTSNFRRWLARQVLRYMQRVENGPHSMWFWRKIWWLAHWVYPYTKEQLEDRTPIGLNAMELGHYWDDLEAPPRKPNPVLERFYEADARLSKEASNDIIFEWFDERYQAGDFAACNVILGEVEVERLSTKALIAILSITLPCKSLLDNRSGLFWVVEEKLRAERPAEVDGLLIGLE